MIQAYSRNNGRRRRRLSDYRQFQVKGEWRINMQIILRQKGFTPEIIYRQMAFSG
jgi:hypothetical protein